MTSALIIDLTFVAERPALHAKAAWWNGDTFTYEFMSNEIRVRDFHEHGSAGSGRRRTVRLHRRGVRHLMAIRHATGALTLVRRPRGLERLRKLRAVVGYLRPPETLPLDDLVLGILFNRELADSMLDSLHRLNYSIVQMNWEDVIERGLLPLH